MSHEANTKYLDSLWEQFEELNGNVEEFCKKIDIASPKTTPIKVIEELEAEIDRLKT